MTYSVNADDLSAAAVAGTGSARSMAGLGPDLGRLLRRVGDAAADPAVAGEASTASRQWARLGSLIGDEARGLARGVGGAGDDYRTVEGAEVRRFGAGR